MLWFHLPTVVLGAALLVVLVLSALQPKPHRHSAREGALDVWRLIEEVEARRHHESPPTGRHHLRPETLARPRTITST